ncbi:pentapeptide repeat-containing protein [Candidatus Magnetobacterium bavaricum]|uniref:Pentapeptide repeat-containing protein n=1 Tax=Candidatus Magnetobacterium bavaricum TaxID=29290 RepID=A0A0F3GV65_9BACT|nr:pentapeptide repeat-containing protein [Candidatus Magnetobacterium bavaricum]KJU85863.1 pentapeptide repeat-containing protein [Candidatus Magnetobacterium bavaricum]
MKSQPPGIKLQKPTALTNKPLKIDFKKLLGALGRAMSSGVLMNWGLAASNAADSVFALGLTPDVGELAFILVHRTIIKTLIELLGESVGERLAEAQINYDNVTEQLDTIISNNEVIINKNFLDHPSELPVIRDIQDIVKQWLVLCGLKANDVESIVGRLPDYFAYTLIQELRKNANSYKPIIEALDSPLHKGAEKEWAWSEYAAFLQRRVEECVFDETFSLSQIYVPLNAYYVEGISEVISRSGRTERRVVINLEEEMYNWLQSDNREDTIRVISGSPGSGKSSFARMFAARLAKEGRMKVLYIPLHLIDATKSLVEEIGQFVKYEGVLLHNPLALESLEPNLLIILDGLDELASQGKAAAETAKSFVREVERTVERRNMSKLYLRVIINGREFVVQENESEFRRARQILNLLPYYHHTGDAYHDPKRLLKNDLRDDWWKKYGYLTGKGYGAMPEELKRNDLEEITAQPLLNYLLALSYTRGKLDFRKDFNLNLIYSDLVAAVYERGYEKKRRFISIRHMTLEDFTRMLEEIGLATWHGDGRTTTVREIEEHCRISGIARLLDGFKEGAKKGVTRLLAAFFFRQYGGQRESGEQIFVFTDKSFGEYLTARRIVRAMDRIVQEMQRRKDNIEVGWDERDALKHWCQICGLTAISPYIHIFFINELRLRFPEEEILKWQEYLTSLFNYMLRNWMPMEQLQLRTFREMHIQSRNAEEALLVALNACARLTGKISELQHPYPAAFGDWFRRIQWQQSRTEPVLAVRCLSFLNLRDTDLYLANLIGADLSGADLRESNLSGVNLRGADLRESDLSGANLREADLRESDLSGANIRGANLRGANLRGTNLRGANLSGANLRGANLTGADLREAVSIGANIIGADMKGLLIT